MAGACRTAGVRCALPHRSCWEPDAQAHTWSVGRAADGRAYYYREHTGEARCYCALIAAISTRHCGYLIMVHCARYHRSLHPLFRLFAPLGTGHSTRTELISTADSSA
jgi:hypothetical protein